MSNGSFASYAFGAQKKLVNTLLLVQEKSDAMEEL